MHSVLRSPIDPIRRVRRQIRLTWLVGTLTIVMCTLWAARPVQEYSPEDTTFSFNLAQLSAQPIEHGPHTIDPRVFAARLWNPPPTEVALKEREASVANRPKPIRFQLIGIINENGQLRAALYDPDTNRVLIVKSGDRIDELTVTAVTAESVELSDGKTTSRLALIEERS